MKRLLPRISAETAISRIHRSEGFSRGKADLRTKPSTVCEKIAIGKASVRSMSVNTPEGQFQNTGGLPASRSRKLGSVAIEEFSVRINYDTM